MSPDTATETATFRSRDQNLTLVVDPATEMTDTTGKRVPVPGKRIEFRNGEYDATSSEELEFLRGHRLLNVDFYEVGNEPGRPKPEADEVIAGIMRALKVGDADEIRQLVQLEYASFSRPAVVNAGREALKLLKEDPDEGTKPEQPTGVSPEVVEAVAKELQARLDDSDSLVKPSSQTVEEQQEASNKADEGDKPDTSATQAEPAAPEPGTEGTSRTADTGAVEQPDAATLAGAPPVAEEPQPGLGEGPSPAPSGDASASEPPAEGSEG